jgi:hypothetical protein
LKQSPETGARFLRTILSTNFIRFTRPRAYLKKRPGDLRGRTNTDTGGATPDLHFVARIPKMKSVKTFGLAGTVVALLLTGIAGAEEPATEAAKDPLVAACEKEASESGITDKEDMKLYVADCVAAMKAEQQGGAEAGGK